MEQINQLKTMRDDALSRLQANPDYRLLVSLDQLIVDLETVTQPPRSGLSVVDDSNLNGTSTVDDVMSQMSAELEASAKESTKPKGALS